MDPVLKGKLVASDVYDSAEPIKLRFDLTNSGAEDLYVLKWNTPLEGLNSDCLKVIRGENNKVAYDGPMIKRGSPGPEDYVLVPAGENRNRPGGRKRILRGFRARRLSGGIEHPTARACCRTQDSRKERSRGSGEKLSHVTGGNGRQSQVQGEERSTANADAGLRQHARRPRRWRNRRGLLAPPGQSKPPPPHCPQPSKAAHPVRK